MIPWIAAAFLVVGSIVLVRVFRLVEKSQRVLTIARHSLGVIRSPSLTDEEKEAALRDNTRQLCRLSFLLSLGGVAAVGLPLGVLWLCDRVGWVSLASVLGVAVSPAFLIVCGLLAILALWAGSRKPPATSGYSALDRTLHRLAFRTYAAQVPLADLETRLFAKRLAPCRVDRPVFITALPRAGTTLLLECCAGLGEFASHCYRDMPFVLTPCLWSGFARAFRRTGQPRERAHGDGVLIDFDSPEALEEVLWKTFWRRHYRSDRVLPWRDEEDPEFDEFFRAHMRKIIHLRRGEDEPGTARYVSKNNLNIARLGMLRRLFPDSAIVVPFRQPLEQAASLLEQHRHFLRIHQQDRFASEYMRAIAHYDFGKNLRPVDFDGWLDRRESEDTDGLAFWLEYWVVSYRWLLTQSADCLCFLSYDRLCREPERGLKRLAEAIGSRDCDALLSAAARIRPARPREVDAGAVPASLVEKAGLVHAKLREAARA